MNDEKATFRLHLNRVADLLVAEGDGAPFQRDLGLHLLSIGARHEPDVLDLLTDGLTAMALYLISRPRFDHFGWTVQLQEPLINLFFAGSASDGSVVGRAFSSGVQRLPQNTLFVQTARPFGELQTSSIEFEGRDIFGMVEQYCAQSDQQTARLLRGAGRRAAMMLALPEVDMEWFSSVQAEEVFSSIDTRALKTVAEHRLMFHCGCNRPKITEIVTRLYEESPDDLFRGDSAIEAECPRCGAKHVITRADFDSRSGE